jgi:hypothetical protein
MPVRSKKMGVNTPSINGHVDTIPLVTVPKPNQDLKNRTKASSFAGDPSPGLLVWLMTNGWFVLREKYC